MRRSERRVEFDHAIEVLRRPLVRRAPKGPVALQVREGRLESIGERRLDAAQVRGDALGETLDDDGGYQRVHLVERAG